ncbi:MAG: hypothetical protein EBU85_01685 [Actinobacteria bacterium]|nr:hypothetical protein [Actinomycetota bacterium]
MSTAAPTCGDIALAIAEPIVGTASAASHWLLIEHPSAWGSHVVNDIIDPETRAALKERGITALAVRTASQRSIDRPLRLWLVDGARMSAVVWECEGSDVRDAEVRSLALTGSAPEHAHPWSDPLLLVCTNGKRDVCCAVAGRAIMSNISAEHAPFVLESSHLGGHRFAGVTLLLPAGYMHRCVDAAHATRILEKARIGQLEAHGLRGRCSLTPAQQCAEVTARETWVDWALHLQMTYEEINDSVRVTASDGLSLDVTVETGVGPIRPESCGGEGKPLHWVRATARTSH